MPSDIIVTLISTSGAVITGIFGMWISTNQLGKRIDRLEKQYDRLEDRFSTFQEVVNGKLKDLDTEVARILDKIK